MKLFWGMLETTPRHQHTFDAAKWKRESGFTIQRYSREKGEIAFYHNTCLTCGDLVERRFEHIFDFSKI